MDIISKKRGEGKTSELIKLSSQTGIPIAYCGQGAEYLLRLAKHLGCTIPEPIHISLLKSTGCTSAYIDDADRTLSQLLGVETPAISITS